MRPDYTDLIATAKHIMASDEDEAIATLRAYKKAWHETDLRDISVSVDRNVREIMHRLNVIAK
jgi:predicted GNAT family N-acyltransferase